VGPLYLGVVRVKAAQYKHETLTVRTKGMRSRDERGEENQAGGFAQKNGHKGRVRRWCVRVSAWCKNEPGRAERRGGNEQQAKERSTFRHALGIQMGRGQQRGKGTSPFAKINNAARKRSESARRLRKKNAPQGGRVVSDRETEGSEDGLSKLASNGYRRSVWGAGYLGSNRGN